MRVDLNADVGESFGVYPFGHDAGLLKSVTSVSVAAGFHGGDPSVLRNTIRQAKDAGVAVGAHPGFPDLVGFGRRALTVTAREAEDFVLYQLAAVAGVAAAEGVRLQHVKPHGALYAMASRDPELAAAIARATAAIDRNLVMFGPGESALVRAAQSHGLATAAEGFADRSYHPDGSLAPRAESGAVLTDPATVLLQAIRMVRDQAVVTSDGTTRPLTVETICIHSDTAGADVLAATLRSGLEASGILVRAVRDRA
jgi:UPF0271 protein